MQRLAVADRLHQPQLLEVGDVAQVPGQWAEDRRVDAVELIVGERLDQLQGSPPRLGEALRDRILGVAVTSVAMGRPYIGAAVTGS